MKSDYITPADLPGDTAGMGPTLQEFVDILEEYLVFRRKMRVLKDKIQFSDQERKQGLREPDANQKKGWRPKYRWIVRVIDDLVDNCGKKGILLGDKVLARHQRGVEPPGNLKPNKKFGERYVIWAIRKQNFTTEQAFLREIISPAFTLTKDPNNKDLEGQVDKIYAETRIIGDQIVPFVSGSDVALDPSKFPGYKPYHEPGIPYDNLLYTWPTGKTSVLTVKGIDAEGKEYDMIEHLSGLLGDVAEENERDAEFLDEGLRERVSGAISRAKSWISERARTITRGFRRATASLQRGQLPSEKELTAIAEELKTLSEGLDKLLAAAG